MHSDVVINIWILMLWTFEVYWTKSSKVLDIFVLDLVFLDILKMSDV